MATSPVDPEDIMLPPSPPELADPSAAESNLQLPAQDHERYESNTDAPIPPFPRFSNLQTSPRNHSSLPKTHLRSKSLADPVSAPSMIRAHSSPGLDSRGRYVFSGSQGGSPNSPGLQMRRPSPLRVSVDGTALQTSNESSIRISTSIPEQPELLETPSSSPRMQIGTRSVSPSWSPVPHHTVPRVARRRPSSPLYPSATSNPAGQGAISSHPPSHPPPLIISAKFNEPYPNYSFSSGSSMPSTPSSIRSRSPSISSLETIPDIPDAEVAAIEADQIAKLKAAADKADAAAANMPNDMKRRSAIDMPGSTSPFGTSRFGTRGSDKRKRWSVCGAEARQDLDLETIWED